MRFVAVFAVFAALRTGRTFAAGCLDRSLGGVRLSGLALVLLDVIVVVVIAVLVVGEVGVMEEGTLLGADADERCLEPRLYCVDLPEVDVTDHPLVLRTVDLQFNELVVLDDRDAHFPLRRADKDLALHGWGESVFPRNRTGSTTRPPPGNDFRSAHEGRPEFFSSPGKGVGAACDPA